MTPVTVPVDNVNQCMEMVYELRAQGLVQGVHFDFKFKPAQFDATGLELTSERCVEFLFYNEKYATLFTLKYAQ
jgi:hypothetical protein